MSCGQDAGWGSPGLTCLPRKLCQKSTGSRQKLAHSPRYVAAAAATHHPTRQQRRLHHGQHGGRRFEARKARGARRHLQQFDGLAEGALCGLHLLFARARWRRTRAPRPLRPPSRRARRFLPAPPRPDPLLFLHRHLPPPVPYLLQGRPATREAPQGMRVTRQAAARQRAYQQQQALLLQTAPPAPHPAVEPMSVEPAAAKSAAFNLDPVAQRDPQLCHHYTKDIYSYLQQLELAHRVSPQFMQARCRPPLQTGGAVRSASAPPPTRRTCPSPPLPAAPCAPPAAPLPPPGTLRPRAPPPHRSWDNATSTRPCVASSSIGSSRLPRSTGSRQRRSTSPSTTLTGSCPSCPSTAASCSWLGSPACSSRPSTRRSTRRCAACRPPPPPPPPPPRPQPVAPLRPTAHPRRSAAGGR